MNWSLKKRDGDSTIQRRMTGKKKIAMTVINIETAAAEKMTMPQMTGLMKIMSLMMLPRPEQ